MPKFTLAQNHRADGAEGATAAVFRLVYRSRSRLPEAEADPMLADLLRSARAHNQANGITGALVGYDRWFAQVLEGDEAAVTRLFAAIRLDPRHSHVELITQACTSYRVFAGWSMALVREHGQPDMPLLATTTGTTEGQAWRLSPSQEVIVQDLRDLTRGYGPGS